MFKKASDQLVFFYVELSRKQKWEYLQPVFVSKKAKPKALFDAWVDKAKLKMRDTEDTVILGKIFINFGKQTCSAISNQVKVFF